MLTAVVFFAVSMPITFKLSPASAPLVTRRQTVPTPRSPLSAAATVEVRFLTIGDLPELLALEHVVWREDQMAGAQDMANRIRRHPQFCVGVFCRHSGQALASLFVKPACKQALQQARNWRECVESDGNGAASHDALFGISLTSIRPEGAQALFDFFWPHALKGGWRELYLGSPIPGLSEWVNGHPGQPIHDYVHSRRSGQPLDPQLRYYFKKGIRRIVRVCPDYFPHSASLDYGVIIGGRIPLARWAPLWRRLPLPWLQRMSRWLFVLR